MKRFGIIITLLLLVLTLSACDLPEVTPPVEVLPATATPDSQFIPLPSPTDAPEVVRPEVITPANAGNLVLTKKAAVSNIQHITFSDDGQILALTTQNFDANDAQVYSLTMLNTADLSTKSIYTSTDQRIAAVSPDGHTAVLVSASLDAFSLVDTLGSAEDSQTIILPEMINTLSVSADSRYLAVSKMEKWEVELFDLASLEPVKTLTGFETAAPVYNAGFERTSQWLVWHARGTIQLQEIETGVLSPVFSHEDFVSTYALSPDGTLLASAAGKTVNGEMMPAVILWDTMTGAELRVLPHPSSVSALAFSPDGKLLAAATGNTIVVWNTLDGSLVATLSGHADMVTQVAFAPDQNALATSGADNQLYLWQVIP
jgi:WD40 repeat protein